MNVCAIVAQCGALPPLSVMRRSIVMTQADLQMTQITLATTRTEAMARFYGLVFGTDFQPFDVAGTALYRGSLHDATFVLCPNSLAEVQAERSRHQFTYTVSDLAATIERAVAAGGTVDEEANGHDIATSVTVRDPDDNSIVFLQAS
jgi:predicted enzyme related to lactoylglutathione lyase